MEQIAYGADIALPVVREPPLGDCYGVESGHPTNVILARFTSGPYYRRAVTAFIQIHQWTIAIQFRD
jgi:hypothetical protein